MSKNSLENLSEASHSIPLSEAVAMTERYRKNRDAILKEEYQYSDILALNETFNKDYILKMLSVEKAVGMRVYYGMSENLEVHAILVAVGEDGEDILPPVDPGNGNVGDDPSASILEDAVRCPTECPPPSPLNKG